jgi:hypothetical protein
MAVYRENAAPKAPLSGSVPAARALPKAVSPGRRSRVNRLSTFGGGVAVSHPLKDFTVLSKT